MDDGSGINLSRNIVASLVQLKYSVSVGNIEMTSEEIMFECKAICTKIEIILFNVSSLMHGTTIII